MGGREGKGGEEGGGRAVILQGICHFVAPIGPWVIVGCSNVLEQWLRLIRLRLSAPPLSPYDLITYLEARSPHALRNDGAGAYLIRFVIGIGQVRGWPPSKLPRETLRSGAKPRANFCAKRGGYSEANPGASPRYHLSLVQVRGTTPPCSKSAVPSLAPSRGNTPTCSKSAVPLPRAPSPP